MILWRLAKSHIGILLALLQSWTSKTANLHSISHRFQVIADDWSNFPLWQDRRYRSLTDSFWINPLNSQPRKCGLKKLENHPIVRCKMQTDRRRTWSRLAIARSLIRTNNEIFTQNETNFLAVQLPGNRVHISLNLITLIMLLFT